MGKVGIGLAAVISAAAVAVSLSTSGGTGGGSIGGGGAGGGGGTSGAWNKLANIWVDPSGGSCTRSVSQIAYPNNGTECGSLDAAVKAASPGDTIGWHGGAGSYPYQVITSNAGLRNLATPCDPHGEWGAASTTNCIQIRPDSNINVTGKIEIHSSDIWLEGVRTGSNPPAASDTYNIVAAGYIDEEADSNTVYPDHTIIEGVSGRNTGSFNGSYLEVKDSDFGGSTWTTSVAGVGPCFYKEGDGFENKIGLAGGTTRTPDHVVWDGLYIHDFNRDANAAANDVCHGGGMILMTANTVLLKNDVWSQNMVYNIEVQNFGGGVQAHDVTIENNWFGCPVGELSTGNNTTCNGQDDIQFDSDGTAFTNWLIHYNSWAEGAGCYSGTCTYSNSRMIGNVGAIPSAGACNQAGLTDAYNVFVGGTCSGTDTTISSLSALYTNATPGSEDFHLLNGTNAANNFVPNSGADYALATDIDGQTRPIDVGGKRDAGSDER